MEDRDIINALVMKCKEELEWCEACKKEMNLPGNPHKYTEEDMIYFSCWSKAHKRMLDIIEGMNANL